MHAFGQSFIRQSSDRIAATVLADRLHHSEPGIGVAQAADALGAALVTSSLMQGVYTIVGEAADNGWTSSRTLVLGGVALVLFVGFVAPEATYPRPLLPLRVFKSREVSGANVVQPLMVAGMFGLFPLGTLFGSCCHEAGRSSSTPCSSSQAMRSSVILWRRSTPCTNSADASIVTLAPTINSFTASCAV